MEGDAGTGRMNPTDPDEPSSSEVKTEDSSESETPAEDRDSATRPAPVVARRPSRLDRGWLIGITAALLLIAGGVGAGGHFALRAHLDSQTIARR